MLNKNKDYFILNKYRQFTHPCTKLPYMYGFPMIEKVVIPLISIVRGRASEQIPGGYRQSLSYVKK